MEKLEFNIKLAIILPVYNTEKYLNKFFIELGNQDFQDFHIYAVNDGSTDCSLNILEEWSKKQERLFILNKCNGGVSSARNLALDKIRENKIKYKYIYFCDSDDYLDHDTLSKLILAMDSADADYGLFSVRRVYKDKVVVAKQKIHNNICLLYTSPSPRDS